MSWELPIVWSWRIFAQGPTALCYALVLPGRKFGFRTGFRPPSSWESPEIGPSGGRRPAGGPFVRIARLESGRNPARKPDLRPGSIIVQHRVLVEFFSRLYKVGVLFSVYLLVDAAFSKRP